MGKQLAIAFDTMDVSVPMDNGQRFQSGPGKLFNLISLGSGMYQI